MDHEERRPETAGSGVLRITPPSSHLGVTLTHDQTFTQLDDRDFFMLLLLLNFERHGVQFFIPFEFKVKIENYWRIWK